MPGSCRPLWWDGFLFCGGGGLSNQILILWNREGVERRRENGILARSFVRDGRRKRRQGERVLFPAGIKWRFGVARAFLFAHGQQPHRRWPGSPLAQRARKITNVETLNKCSKPRNVSDNLSISVTPTGVLLYIVQCLHNAFYSPT